MSTIGIPRTTFKAEPKFSVNQLVRYYDRQDRWQTGHIKSIEASWPGYGHGDIDPLVIYRLYHPSYRNNDFYTTDARIDRALTDREIKGYRFE